MPARLAILTDDAFADGLLDTLLRHVPTLRRFGLIASEDLARRLRESTAQDVEEVAELSHGGDLQIAARVLAGDVAAVFAVLDPSHPGRGAEALSGLTRACCLADVPLAINPSTASLCLLELSRRRAAWLIFNPVAGQGNPAQELALIRQFLEPSMHLTTVLTRADLDPAIQAREVVARIREADAGARADGEAGAEDHSRGILIASGGDGTVSAIAGATIDTGIPLGVIPRGTANAFALALGIPTDLRQACLTIANGHVRQVDAALCNDRPMILLAGMGFEAGMVDRASRDLKNRLGALAYVLSGVQQVMEQELFHATITIDGQVSEVQTAAVTVANAAPATSVMAQGFGTVVADDGLLEVTIATPQSRMQGVNMLASLFVAAMVRGESDRDDLLRLRTPSLTIRTDPPQLLVVDGELMEADPVSFTCLPGALRVLAPLPIA